MSCECMYPLPHTPEGHKAKAHEDAVELIEQENAQPCCPPEVHEQEPTPTDEPPCL